MELLAIAFALCSIYLLQLQLFHFDSGKQLNIWYCGC